MTPIGNQRWLEKKDSYRPPAEVIQTADYEVAAIPRDVAKTFVTCHHYSGSVTSMNFQYGLHRHGQLVGVAIFSEPMRKEVFNPLPCPAEAATELGRFVLLDEVPGNGETWFLGRCFAELRKEGQRGVVSFSDPTPRTDVNGRQMFAGHVGTIYQASNAVLVGRSKARLLKLLPDCCVLNERAVAKIRAGGHGAGYSAEILERYGADPLGVSDPREWLEKWLPLLTRPLRHEGNWKYAWALDRCGKKAMPISLPYPKKIAA
jgi:hypothetical protein